MHLALNVTLLVVNIFNLLKSIVSLQVKIKKKSRVTTENIINSIKLPDRFNM